MVMVADVVVVVAVVAIVVVVVVTGTVAARAWVAPGGSCTTPTLASGAASSGPMAPLGGE